VQRGFAPVLAALLAVALAACGGGRGSPRGRPETATITVGVPPVVDAAPLYLAERRGYFRQEGLTVRFQQLQGGGATIPAMVAGSVQVSFASYVSLFLAKSQGTDLTVIADGDRARPGFGGVYTMPSSPIRAPADLAGKKVAVDSLNDVDDLSTTAVLQAAGVDAHQLHFVQVPFPEMGVTLRRGQVDAVWVAEPYATSVKGTLNARRIVDPFSGPTAGLPVAGYAVTRRFADGNPRTVAAFVRALREGVADAADPSKVASVLPRYTSITADLAGRLTLPQYAAVPDPARLQRVADLMRQQGKVAHQLDVASFTRAGG
jgi:NitT/TauT family transport system substrate-binding protein